MFDIQLFGRFEVRTRGVCLTGADLGGDRPRQLLALLALRGDSSISELAELLRVPVTVVDAELAVLRRGLEPDVDPLGSVIVAYRDRLLLDPERVRIDVARFDELIAAAAGRPPQRAVKPLAAAAFLATRPLLEGEDAPWAAEARAQYRAKLIMARRGLVTHVI
jgi:hypothetical protein